MKKIIVVAAMVILSACQNNIEQIPAVEPPAAAKTQQIPDGVKIAGAVETLYVTPIAMPFQARMDTGAETSSLDANNIRPFERDGEKWVSFDVINRKNGEKHHFEKPVKRRTTIVRIKHEEARYVVNMSIKMGDELINAEFTLAERDKFNYQVLIGRNILNGRFIIDPSLENTMH